MSVTQKPQRTPIELLVDSGDDLIHRACCIDDDAALCGASLEDGPWGSGQDNIRCATCELMDGESTCPYGFGECP